MAWSTTAILTSDALSQVDIYGNFTFMIVIAWLFTGPYRKLGDLRVMKLSEAF
jgi:hypothetical protein